VRDRDVAQSAVGIGEVDRAPVGDRVHAHAGYRLERGVHVQGGVERGADVGQQPRLLQGRALGVDQARDADDRLAAPLVDDQPPARVVPVHRAVRPGDPHLVLAGRAVGRGRGDRRFQPGAVLGVHAFEERLEGWRRLIGRHPGQRGQRRRPAQLAGRHVHAERAGAHGIEHQSDLVAAEALLS
jgi:hypothetical protein